MIEVRADGVRKAIQELRDTQKRVEHGSPFFRRAALRMHRDVMTHFREEQGPKGAWAPWSPSTVAARKRGRGGTKKLQDTGLLRGSILFQGLEHDARVYTETVYAATHQEGDSSRNIPARPFMWIADGTVEELKLDFVPWLLGGIVRGG